MNYRNSIQNALKLEKFTNKIKSFINGAAPADQIWIGAYDIYQLWWSTELLNAPVTSDSKDKVHHMEI